VSLAQYRRSGAYLMVCEVSLSVLLSQSSGIRTPDAGVKTVVDNSLLTQGSEINFNAGLRTVSVLHLAVEDYLKIEEPHVLEFTTTP
jgi:hypothetical protein